MARQKWTSGDYAQQSERTKRQKYDARVQLQQLGISERDAGKLLRAANELHRWHELECGTEWPADRMITENVEREEGTEKPFLYRRGHFQEYCQRKSTYEVRRYPTSDLEKLAKATIAGVMAQHPTLGYYIQEDPRGCSLYILRPGDVPEGQSADVYYSRGIAVYKE